jgi:hypothetical protein
MTTSIDVTDGAGSLGDLWFYSMIPFMIAKYILIILILELLLLRTPMFLYNYWFYKR